MANNTGSNYTNSIKLRAESNSPLSWSEMDDNTKFANLWEFGTAYKTGMTVLWDDSITPINNDRGILSNWLCDSAHVSDFTNAPGPTSNVWSRIGLSTALYNVAESSIALTKPDKSNNSIPSYYSIAYAVGPTAQILLPNNSKIGEIIIIKDTTDGNAEVGIIYTDTGSIDEIAPTLIIQSEQYKKFAVTLIKVSTGWNILSYMGNILSIE